MCGRPILGLGVRVNGSGAAARCGGAARIAAAALVCVAGAGALAQATSASDVAATAPADGGRVTCAVLPTGLSAGPGDVLLHLIDQELLKQGRYQVVERQQLGAVLNEQLLQAAVAAEGIRARQDVGKIIRADLLVLIAQPESAMEGGAVVGASATKAEAGDVQAYVPVVVAETKHGLRLLDARPSWDERNPEGTVREVAGLVETARQTLAGGIRAVFAVPPFESEDLSFERCHLMGAYAALVAQALARQPGVLTVELAEARAVARELTLSSGPATVDRAPYYILGRYKHHGVGDRRTVTVRVELRQGDVSIATVEKAEIGEQEAARVLLAAVDALLAKAIDVGAGRTREPGAAAEAALLRKGAAGFMRAGNWAQAYPLYEASLLLEPGDAHAHFDAVVVLMRLMWLSRPDKGPPERFVQDGRRVLAMYRVALEHVEHFWRLNEDIDDAEGVAAWLTHLRHSLLFWPRLRYVVPRSPVAAALAEERTALLLEDRELLFRVLEEKRAQGRLTRRMAVALVPVAAQPHIALYRSDDDYYATCLRAIRLLADDADGSASDLIVAILMRWNLKHRTPRYEEFLRDVEGIPGEHVLRALAEVRARMELESAAPEPPPEATSKRATYLGLRTLKDDELGLPDGMTGADFMMPLDPGRDLFVYRQQLYVVAERGQARAAFPTQRVPASVWPPSYTWDGEYLWRVSGQSGEQLEVLDLDKGNAWRFGEADGLPPGAANDVVAGVRPGCACVVSTTRGPAAQHGWCGLVELDAQHGRVSVQVLREFRADDDASYYATSQAVPDDVALFTTCAVTLTDPDDQNEKRVLVSQRRRTLLVDPARRTIRSLPGLGRTRSIAVRDGNAYWVDDGADGRRRSLVLRMGFPDFVPIQVAQLPEYAPGAPVCFDGDAVHVIGRSQWWYAPHVEGPFTGLRTIPRNTQSYTWCLWCTHNYGLILRENANGRLQAVDVLTEDAGDASAR